MDRLLFVIFFTSGILALVVFPKLIVFALFLAIGYFTIFVNYYFGALFIPLLIILLIYKRRRKNRNV